MRRSSRASRRASTSVTSDRAELEHYDAEYARSLGGGPVDPEVLGQLWRDNPYSPWDGWMLEAMGELRDQVVVVLGNGLATKELHLLARHPRALVISDLSSNAMRAVRESFRVHAGREDLFFAAIDGQDLPFADGSVDVLYGYAFVHHLPDLDRFLAEAARVLRPGGRAVFTDNAYSALWQRAKHGWLRSAMHLAHRRNPISEEDVRYTLAGGFAASDLEPRVAAVGARRGPGQPGSRTTSPPVPRRSSRRSRRDLTSAGAIGVTARLATSGSSGPTAASSKPCFASIAGSSASRPCVTAGCGSCGGSTSRPREAPAELTAAKSPGRGYMGR